MNMSSRRTFLNEAAEVASGPGGGRLGEEETEAEAVVQSSSSATTWWTSSRQQRQVFRRAFLFVHRHRDGHSSCSCGTGTHGVQLCKRPWRFLRWTFLCSSVTSSSSPGVRVDGAWIQFVLNMPDIPVVLQRRVPTVQTV